jgi:glycosyltransferase involved in cell wall biosynthesis
MGHGRFGTRFKDEFNKEFAMTTQDVKSVSIVVPVYNEQDNVGLAVEEISGVMNATPYDWELIFVDDGSRDETVPRLKALALDHPRLRLVLLRRNFGQTAAMHAGIQAATGDVTVTIDGDLQNDPRDIPMMLEKLSEGYDLVHGWRRRRQDAYINRKLPSKIANWLISRTTGFPIRDLGCTLKAIRTEIAQQLELYGEMHRFIPILAYRLGARCVEVETNHRARQFGKTKYGIGRTSRVVLDLLTVKYMLKYFDSPMKLFGMIGMWVAAVATLSLLAALLMKAISGVDLTGNPLTLLSTLSTILSVQFFSIGLLGEVNARIYFRDNQHRNYQVRELVNFVSPPSTIGFIDKRAA